jgi:two-component system, chemotaxis family, chemotaxis protein CheY
MADILIVEDDPQVRHLLTHILRHAGHAAREADNGRTGIAEFHDQRPALVICDILMPDMEGIETVLALRREDPTTPIIAISGGDRVHLKLVAKLGATATLKKPLLPHVLLSLVDGLLAGSHTTLTP